MPESVEIEFWLRNDSTKTLLETFEIDEDGWFRFEYPQDGHLWLRVKQLPEDEFAVYELYILRHTPNLEASWGELSADWGERTIAIPNRGTDPYRLDFASDSEGDTIRVKSASRMEITP